MAVLVGLKAACEAGNKGACDAMMELANKKPAGPGSCPNKTNPAGKTATIKLVPQGAPANQKLPDPTKIMGAGPLGKAPPMEQILRGQL